MRELLGDLGFRHTKEEVLEPAARVWGTPSRRLEQKTLGGGGGYGGQQLLGFEERDLCVLGGSPAPPYIGGGAGRTRGGESLPNSAWRWKGGGGGTPPQLGFLLFLHFPKIAV